MVYLRLERIGNMFSAYCSDDGTNWMTCGQANFPAEDPIQVGIHATSTTGLYGHRTKANEAAMRFDYFRLLRRA
jgi:regulation of enolase protein 1 (concanavalin A-like superfamily)